MFDAVETRGSAMNVHPILLWLGDVASRRATIGEAVAASAQGRPAAQTRQEDRHETRF